MNHSSEKTTSAPKLLKQSIFGTSLIVHIEGQLLRKANWCLRVENLVSANLRWQLSLQCQKAIALLRTAAKNKLVVKETSRDGYRNLVWTYQPIC